MKKAVLGNRILLGRTKELTESLQENLTYYFNTGRPTDPPEMFCDLGFINEHILSIPIGRQDLIPKDYKIKDKRTLKPIVFPDFKKTLRASQQEIFDDVLDNCIINARPGFGKTFAGLAIAGKLSQRCLIIVTTVKLRKQWEDEIYKVFGIKTGIIGSGNFTIGNTITVGNIQTVRNKVEELSDTFGTVIVDECHHIPANTFKNTLDRLRSRYKLGLSATLTRRDGKEQLLKDYIGGKIYIPPKENTQDPKVYIVNSKLKIPGTHFMPWASRMNLVYDNPEYINLITELASVKAVQGHTVLVLADRINFLEVCSSLTEGSICITSRQLEEERIKLEQSLIDGDKNILYGSKNIYSEGVSIDKFSCLILATAINNKSLIEQVSGRINRLDPTSTRQTELIDVAFNCNTGNRQLQTRLGFYKEEGWDVILL